MKVKDDFVLRKVADSYVVVPVNKLTLDFNGIITLNETGAFLFERLQQGTDREQLLQELLAEYDVSPEKAEKDIDEFLRKVTDADVLE
ncbi:MAG: PqqD family protein [Clostridia bacterium]|nr:PqqD family protein [Clostridia bacterium]